MVEVSELQEFARSMAQYAPATAIFFYPHPFNQGGLIVIAKAERSAWLQLLGEAYRLLPEKLSLHCLRPYELKLLGQPGIFAPPLSVNEFPHLLYWLKHRGSLLFGDDIRHMLPAPPDATRLLAAHIEACTDTFRRYGILPQLIQGKSDRLPAMLTLEAKRLMATALLIHGEWDIDLHTVPARFLDVFTDPSLAEIWYQLDEMGTAVQASEDEAIEGTWLFEQFLNELEKVTQCS